MSDPTTTRPGNPTDPPGRTTPPPGEPAADANDPFTFTQIYREELERLRPGLIDAPAVPYSATHEERHAALKRIFTQVHTKLGGNEGSPTEPLAALCFSGGGIRSATFNLGVLQALARCKVLARFDYLSSVSGGGYIAGWFEAWRRSAHGDVFTEMGKRTLDDPLAPEPGPIDHLREYANYLTPRTGLFSADLWTVVAVVVRNLVLNWLVVIPVLAALVAIPQLALLIVQGGNRLNPWYLGLAGVGLGFLAHLATFLYRERQLKDTAERMRATAGAREVTAAGRARPGSSAGRLQVAVMLVPLWISVLLVATAGMWLKLQYVLQPWPPFQLLACAVGWMVVGPLLSWLVSVLVFRAQNARQRRVLPELLSLLVSGLVSAAVLLFVVIRYGLPWFKDHPPAFVSLGIPAFLAVHLLAQTLFVGGASLSERGTGAHAPTAEMDREWWARYSGWVMVAAVSWLAVSGVVMIAPLLSKAASTAVAGMGGVSGVVVWLAGKSAKTLSGRRDDASGGSGKMEVLLVVAVPLFCAALAMALALGTAVLGRWFTGADRLFEDKMPLETVLRFALMILGLAGIGSLVAGVVNVNRFSLQAMYRNRLVRAYLGASNQRRTPDPFSGFDPADDFFMHELWDDRSPEGPRQRPMACVNATLNLVSGGDKLAWQQRKAESFSMTPLFCGNFHDGYRRTREYGGASGGMRLGSAVAISGAAANPNMGFHSSPGVTFLLTLFNGRLGAWLGNTGKPGGNTFRLPGPRWALRPIFAELFGQTSSRSPYVNLSDGGHFENLGVYEMVLRRCRYLVVCDAAADPDARFADLGNAIRKVRIDFGIPVEFEKAILISPRKDLPTAVFCALATVGYSKVDAGARDGTLIYIKPAVYGRGKKTVPYDVRAYANTSQFFPHETTADQWFDESQFESYRALGLHTIEQITDECADAADLTAFFAAVTGYLKGKEEEKKKEDDAAGIGGLVSAIETYLKETGTAPLEGKKVAGTPEPPGGG